MSYIHLSIHPHGGAVDPQILFLHYPELYRWASIPVDCQKCHQPISAFFRRGNEQILALACPVCSGEVL